MYASEFADEYEDWLSGSQPPRRAGWLALTLGEMRHAPPLCTAPETPVREVVQRMLDEHATAVLVLDHERLLGIFTERDVLSRLMPHAEGMAKPVAQVMTRDPNVLPEA